MSSREAGGVLWGAAALRPHEPARCLPRLLGQNACRPRLAVASVFHQRRPETPSLKREAKSTQGFVRTETATPQALRNACDHSAIALALPKTRPLPVLSRHLTRPASATRGMQLAPRASCVSASPPSAPGKPPPHAACRFRTHQASAMSVTDRSGCAAAFSDWQLRGSWGSAAISPTATACKQQQRPAGPHREPTPCGGSSCGSVQQKKAPD